MGLDPTDGCALKLHRRWCGMLRVCVIYFEIFITPAIKTSHNVSIVLLDTRSVFNILTFLNVGIQ